MLDNGTLTFAADPHEGISYLIATGVLEDRPEAIAEFIHNTALLDWGSLKKFLKDRYGVSSPRPLIKFLMCPTLPPKYSMISCPFLPFPTPRQDVLNVLVKMHRYDTMFLPDALRKFFSLIPAPNERGQFLETLLNLFSQQYLTCNPNLQMGTGKP